MKKDNEPVVTETAAAPEKRGENAPADFPLFVEAEKLLEKLADITHETAFKAFDFFRERGGRFGSELEDWFRAESEILRHVPVEIRETEENLFVSAAVPGFKPEEIEVSLKDDTLFLSGETETKEKVEEGNIIRREWSSNRFFRQLALPTSVDAGKAKANLKEGMLELTLPKAAEKDVTKVAVAAG